MSYYEQEANRWRRMGYADGKTGKPACYSDEHYQRGYREGRRRHFDAQLSPDWLRRNPLHIKLQEKNMAPTTSKRLFVAVVFAERGATLDSIKPGAQGGWESFIGRSQKEAIDKAMNAANKWRISPIDGAKYVVLVGSITAKVKPRAEYDIVAL